MFGEAVNVIMRMIVFDPMFGFFTLLHLWIDYIVYARMDFCFSFMTIFMAGWDLMQIFMHVFVLMCSARQNCWVQGCSCAI